MATRVMPVKMMCNHRPRVFPSHVKSAIKQAKLLCLGYEDTVECRNAWLRVEYMEKQLVEQDKVDEIIRKEMLSKREYDV
jgi:hypothetical protein